MKPYDRKGQPIATWERWVELRTDRDYRRVGVDSVILPNGGLAWVSTVWLGLDHNWTGGQPIIFETMVFADGEDCDQYQARYHTEQQAADGHRLVVVALHEGMELP